MKRFVAILASLIALDAAAWSGDGHSIIAEIASRRLTPEARREAERLLGAGVSLASASSWADDVRTERPETYKWHFVNVPMATVAYDPAIHCVSGPTGDCIVAALERARDTLTCPAGDDARRDALRFALHFIGDLHQPLHTIAEQRGGNDVKVEIEFRGARCPKCTARRTQDNLHQVWDTVIIGQTTWNWGAYVTRLEEGWLRSAEARGADAGRVEDWMAASHRTAAEVWPWLPADNVIGDDYYGKALPIVDRQLGLAGLRLARFLNETLAPKRMRKKCA